MNKVAPLKNIMLFIKNLLLFILTSYLLLLFFAFLFSHKLIFFPPEPSYQDDPSIVKKLKTADGISISAIFLENKKAKYTILVSHGNAEDLGYMTSFLNEMYQHGFSVLAYDYHGYGTSEGTPKEAHTYADIDAAYNYLIQNKQISPKNIILYGRSIGAAISLDLATRKPVAGIIMESPFVSAYKVLTRFAILPFDEFNNLEKIKKITIPLLIIHGERDEIIPPWHSKKLFETTNIENKQYYLVPNAGHNDVLLQDHEKYWQKFVSFTKSI